MLLAEAYRASTSASSEYHEGSIELARKRAADAGIGNRTSFEAASAQTFSGTGYHLVDTIWRVFSAGPPSSPLQDAGAS